MTEGGVMRLCGMFVMMLISLLIGTSRGWGIR